MSDRMRMDKNHKELIGTLISNGLSSQLRREQEIKVLNEAKSEILGLKRVFEELNLSESEIKKLFQECDLNFWESEVMDEKQKEEELNEMSALLNQIKKCAKSTSKSKVEYIYSKRFKKWLLDFYMLKAFKLIFIVMWPGNVMLKTDYTTFNPLINVISLGMETDIVFTGLEDANIKIVKRSECI